MIQSRITKTIYSTMREEMEAVAIEEMVQQLLFSKQGGRKTEISQLLRNQLNYRKSAIKKI